MKKHLFLSTAILFFFSGTAFTETQISPSARKNLSVTIYNENRALVRDERTALLKKGMQQIAFSGVSDQMIPESALLTGDKIEVIEQNFNYDVLSYHTLLEKSVGSFVTLEKTNSATGNTTKQKAKLLSYQNNQPVLQIGNFIEANPKGQILFNTVPKNLRDRPTLVIHVKTEQETEKNLTLRYLTTGLAWQADYVAQLSSDEKSMTLNGYVTLNNQSGTSFEKADLTLVAGDINILRTPSVRTRLYKATDAIMETASMTNGISPESLGDYHLYTLPEKTDLLPRQTKQVALLSVNDIKIEKTYEFNNVIPFSGSAENLKPSIFIRFKNEKENHLGVPLPKGTIRLYQNDTMGRALFIGENTIPHTGNKETLRLYTGQAFDISADARQTEYIRLGKEAYQASYRMTLKNGSDKPIEVQVLQTFPKSFEIVSETVTSTSKTADTRVWTIPLTADAEQTLSYTVRVQK